MTGQVRQPFRLYFRSAWHYLPLFVSKTITMQCIYQNHAKVFNVSKLLPSITHTRSKANFFSRVIKDMRNHPYINYKVELVLCPKLCHLLNLGQSRLMHICSRYSQKIQKILSLKINECNYTNSSEIGVWICEKLLDHVLQYLKKLSE